MGRTAMDVLLVVNGDSWASKAVANKYVHERVIPAGNIVVLNGLPEYEQVTVAEFRESVLGPVFREIQRRGLGDRISCIVYSSDIPYAIMFDGDRGDEETSRAVGTLGSLTGMTYLYADVLEKDYAGYTSLDSNAYYRDEYLPGAATGTPEIDAKLNEANELMRDEEFEKAENILDTLIEKKSAYARLHFELARCRYRAEQDDTRVLAALEQAAKNGWYDLLRVQNSFKKLAEQNEEAMAALEEAVLENAARLETAPTRPFAAQVGWDQRGEATDAPEAPRYMLSAMLPATSGRGLSVDEAFRNLERSARADASADGRGIICFMKSRDIRSRVRRWGFDAAIRELAEAGVAGKVVEGVLPKKLDIMGLCVGAAAFDWAAGGNTLHPGAIAEHLTSFGGALQPGNTQTPLTEFLRHGAALSSGTVMEPLALQAKFPTPFIQAHYARGASAIEALYMSVQGPYQLLVAGDPLTRLFSGFESLSVEGVKSGQALVGTVPLRATTTPEEIAERVSVFVDGQLIARGEVDKAIELDTTKHADGAHAVTLVVSRKDAPWDSRQEVVELVFNNGDDLPEHKLLTPDVRFGEPILIRCDLPEGWRLLLEHFGEPVELVQEEKGVFQLSSLDVGIGPVRLHPVLVNENENGKRMRGRTLEVNVKRPALLAGTGRDEMGDLRPCFLWQVADDEAEAFVGEWEDRHWGRLALQGGERFVLQGVLEATEDGMHQFQLASVFNARIIVDESVLTSDGSGAWHGFPVNLAKGFHHVRVEGVLPEKTGRKPPLMRFGYRGTAPLLPQLQVQASAEQRVRLAQGIELEPMEASFEPFEVTVRLALTEAFPAQVDGVLTFNCELPGDGWEVSPEQGEVAIQKSALAEDTVLRFAYDGRPGQADAFFDVPVVRCAIERDAGKPISQDVLLDLERIGKMKTRKPPQKGIKPFAGALTVDGVLDEPAWQREPDVTNFCAFNLEGPPTMRTHAWLNWTEEGLAVAYRCFETQRSVLHDKSVERDGSVYTRNSVEVLVAPGVPDVSYIQVVVGAAGGLFDSQKFDASWNSQAACATNREEGAWTVELLIPWKGLGLESVQAGTTLRILLARNRFAETHEVLQWPLAPGSNHQPDLFGRIKLLPSER